MSENEREPGNSRSPSGEGGDRRQRVTVFGKDLSAAYVWAISALGAVGAAVPIMALFAKSPTLVLIASVCFVIAVVLVVATARALARTARNRVPMTIGYVMAIVVVAAGLGVAGGMALRSGKDRQEAGNQSSATSSSPASSSASATESTAPSPTPTTSSTAAAPCPQQLTITSPAPGTAIVGHTGVEVGISACGLAAGDQGWLFDVDGGDGSFGRDGAGAVVTGDGTSTFNDVPVGAVGDVKAPVKLTLVLANADCAKKLEAIDWDNNQPASLPQSCRIESQVEVFETY